MKQSAAAQKIETTVEEVMEVTEVQTTPQQGVPHDPYWSTYTDYLANIP